MRRCIVCKRPIDPERADGIPETRLCTQHSEQIQKFGGEFLLESHHERTSKQGSLKHNYGGVSTRTVRNNLAIDRLHDEFEREQFDETD